MTASHFYRYVVTLCMTAGVIGWFPVDAQAGNIRLLPLDTLVHGQIVDDEFTDLQEFGGVTISGTGGTGQVVAYNSEWRTAENQTDPNASGSAGDPDLEGFSTDQDVINAGLNRNWELGNLPLDTPIGNLLVLQENSVPDTNPADGVLDVATSSTDGSGGPSPSGPHYVDDDGSGGTFTFDWTTPLEGLQFDIVDFEGSTQANESFILRIFDENDNQIGSDLGFSEFLTGRLTSKFDNNDPNKPDELVIGNNSINEFPLLTAEDFDDPNTSADDVAPGTNFSRFDFELAGSGSIAVIGVDFLIPAPPAALSLPVLIAVAGWRRWCHRRAS